MKGLQEDIDKLLDIITVLLIRLEDIGDDVVSEIKLILDKSRNEIVVIQDSIRGKHKTVENQFDDDIYEDIEDCDPYIKHEESQIEEEVNHNT